MRHDADAFGRLARPLRDSGRGVAEGVDRLLDLGVELLVVEQLAALALAAELVDRTLAGVERSREAFAQVLVVGEPTQQFAGLGIPRLLGDLFDLLLGLLACHLSPSFAVRVRLD